MEMDVTEMLRVADSDRPQDLVDALLPLKFRLEDGAIPLEHDRHALQRALAGARARRPEAECRAWIDDVLDLVGTYGRSS